MLLTWHTRLTSCSFGSSLKPLQMFQVIRALGGGNGEKRRGGLHLARPKSPNMQELKRRFRQVLSSKVKSATTLWLQESPKKCRTNQKECSELPVKSMRKQQDASTRKILDFVLSGNEAINDRKRPLQGLKYFWEHQLSSDGHVKIEWSPLAEALPVFRWSSLAMWPPFLFFWQKDVQIKYAYTAQQILNPLDSSLGVTQPTNSAFTEWLRVRDLSVVLIFLCRVEALTSFFSSNNSSGNKTFNFVVRLISRWKQPWIWTYNKHSLRVCPVCHIRLDLQNRKWPQNGSIQGFYAETIAGATVDQQ